VKTFNALKVERLEKQKLEEIHKLKLQFFTNISHEFKTPLSLIISPLEKLRESRTSNEWYNKQIDIVYKNARRLLALIDQLLEFRKAEMGKLELSVSKDDLIVFLYDIFSSFANLAKSRGIIYTFEKETEVLEGYFDKSFLEKIMFNLLSNAFKYTPSAGRITLTVKLNVNKLFITVADTGRGIPKEQLPFIYDSFRTIKENNPVGGSGIGLAFTKRLVELHHGTIDLESEPGIGTTFNVTLPITRDTYLDAEISQNLISINISEEESLIGEESDSLKPNSLSKQSEIRDTILIVDDNQDLVNYLVENLNIAYNTDVAYDGFEAMEKVKNCNYDLIISDVMMPNMDGLTFCKKIKQNISTCHIPVILLTVKASIDQQVEGLDTGADDYLGKPFSLRILESKINNLIKSRKRLKEIYKAGLDIHPEQVAYNTLDQEFLKKAVLVVEENLSDPEFSVDEFAKEMFMSRSNLHLKFKAITGDSASDLIKKIRFRKTIELLETGRYNVSEISYMVGFTSPSYFSNRFKKYFGYMPTEYRRKA
jgi:DNA-binding response OmpR family regulator